MTKTIKITTLAAAILLLVGTFFKISHWPGANVIVAVGSVAGILLFIMLMVAFLGKLTAGLEQFNGVFASLILIISFLAFLFKIMHWPGAAILIWIADIGILFAGVLFLIDGLRDKEAYKSTLKIIAGFFILLLVLVLRWMG